MAQFYDEMGNTAHELITEFGMDAILYRKGTASYDPATRSNTASETADNVKVISLAYESHEVNGTVIMATDRKFLMSAKGPTGEPKENDRISVNGVSYNVKSVKSTQPGGVVIIYELQGRK